MDTLQPQIRRIDNRLYRINPTRTSDITVPVGRLEEDLKVNSNDADEFVSGLPSNRLIKPIYIEGDNYVGQINVSPIFHKFIIGKNRASQINLEAEFKCKLVIPKQSDCDSTISVFAKSESEVCGIINRIELLILKVRNQMGPTHFISLPVSDPKLQARYSKFKARVLDKAQDDVSGDYANVCEDLFVCDTKLHFTLAVLFLADETEQALASKLLSSFLYSDKGKALINGSPLRLTVRGFDCMNDDPSAISVLYATLVKDSEYERFQLLATCIADLFTINGLHCNGRRVSSPVNLHLSLLRSKVRQFRREKRGENLSSQESFRFSGIGILRDWAEFTLLDSGEFSEIHLCEMSQSSESESKFYKNTATFSLTFNNYIE